MVRNNELKEILLNNTKLEVLNISFTSLPKIDLSQCVELTQLDLRFNQLSRIDLSRNTKVKEARLANETLESINIENCLELETLDISNSKISRIDISPLQNLREIYMNKTTFKTLDASNNSSLQTVGISPSQLMEMNFIYKNPKMDIKVFPPYREFSVEQINDRKHEIFKTNFPDLNPEDYILKQL
jgi:Leucine-rich repeat (LRR) protein